MADRDYMKETDTGQIISPVDLQTQSSEIRESVLEGKGWISRNSKCPCGSGQKFKRCCMV